MRSVFLADQGPGPNLCFPCFVNSETRTSRSHSTDTHLSLRGIRVQKYEDLARIEEYPGLMIVRIIQSCRGWIALRN